MWHSLDSGYIGFQRLPRKYKEFQILKRHIWEHKGEPGIGTMWKEGVDEKRIIQFDKELRVTTTFSQGGVKKTEGENRKKDSTCIPRN